MARLFLEYEKWRQPDNKTKIKYFYIGEETDNLKLEGNKTI